MAGRKSELCRAGATRIRWELRDQAAVLGDEIASGIPCPRNDEGKSFAMKVKPGRTCSCPGLWRGGVNVQGGHSEK
jgi:hypothetical protein